MPDVPPSLAAALARRYTLERVLGTGGMATVYLAQDLKHGREVAVKVLRPEIALLLGRQRFEREIRRTARLSHAGIIPVYDSGEAAGFLYYVMPVVRGESLKGHISRKGQLAVSEAAGLLEQVAAALQHAHDQGLIHRDIKPANILLSEGQAIVADFGIALATSEVDEQRLTETGLSVGTPQYMSPEQAAGTRELDPRADQYSLACVAYEMLGGDPPFTGSTPRAVIARQITDLPPTLATIRPDLPPAIEAVLRRALAKVPGDRFPSVREFALAFQEASRGGQVSLSAIPAATRRWRPRLTSAVIIGAVLLLGAFVATRMLRGNDQIIRAIAVLPPENLSGDTATTYLVPGIQEELISELGQLREVRVKPRSAVHSYWDPEHSIPALVRGLSVDGVVETSLLPAGENLQLTTKLIRGSNLDVVWARTVVTSKAELLRTVGELAQGLAREAGIDPTRNNARRLTALRSVDPEVYRLVVLAQNENSWDRNGQLTAQRYLSEARLRDPLYAPAYRALSTILVHHLLQSFAKPSEYGIQALEAARRAVQLDSLDAGNYLALADAEFFINWDVAATERAYAKAEALNPSLIAYSDIHSTFLILTGRFDQGVAEMERAARSDPRDQGLRDNLEWSYLNSHRYVEARAMVAWDSTLGGPSEHIGYVTDLIMLDSLPKAGQVLDRIIARRRQPKPLWLDNTLGNRRADYMLLSWAYGMAGRRSQARLYLDSLIALDARDDLPDNPYHRLCACSGIGDVDCAIENLQRMLHEHQPSMMWLGVEPMVSDAVRADPRFGKIMAQAGFGPWVTEPISLRRQITMR